MNKEIVLQNRKIQYSIRRSNRAKRLRIAVYCNCDVVVTLPHHKEIADIEAYLNDKANWITEKLNYFRNSKKFNLANIKKKSVNFEENKENAHKFVLKTIRKFTKVYELKYNKINIKDHKTKWGSCSKKGNINFNYRIIFLPKRLAEYIVVHELCHLIELSHSKRYWALVEKGVPDYKILVKELQSI